MTTKSLGYSSGWGVKSEKTNLELAFYRRYTAMRSRCHLKNAIDFKFYGAKGIKTKWNSFGSFHSDMWLSFKKHVSKYGIQNTTLDRLNVRKDYCKENCRWATRQEQSINRSSSTMITFDGITDTMTGWSRRTGIQMSTISRRIKKYGLSPKDALTRAVKKGANQYKT